MYEVVTFTLGSLHHTAHSARARKEGSLNFWETLLLIDPYILGTAPPPVAVYIRGPIKGYIYPYYIYTYIYIYIIQLLLRGRGGRTQPISPKTPHIPLKVPQHGFPDPWEDLKIRSPI